MHPAALLSLAGGDLKLSWRASIKLCLYSDNQDAMSATIRMRLRGWILG